MAGWYAPLRSVILTAIACLHFVVVAPLAVGRAMFAKAFDPLTEARRLHLEATYLGAGDPGTWIGRTRARAFLSHREQRTSNRRAFVAGGGSVGVGLAFA